MGIGKKVKTILQETFAAPFSDSYVVKEAGKPLVLREGGDYHGIDLRGLDLTGISLENANLQGAQLNGTVLAGANLKNADLSGADLSGAVLSGANLQDAKIDTLGLQAATAIDPPRGLSAEGLDLLKNEA
jgi:uncharacterized protein YjbI with pentapeptide repeats